MVREDVERRQVVDRPVEEPLDLAGVEVDGDHAVGARRLDQVGHQLGRDGLARLHLLVLAGVAEVGDDRVDAPGRGPPQRVHQHQQLHQVVVDGRTGRLDDEAVGAAHRLLERDARLAIGELRHRAPRERAFQVAGDRLGQRRRGAAGEELDVVAGPHVGDRSLRAVGITRHLAGASGAEGDGLQGRPLADDTRPLGNEGSLTRAPRPRVGTLGPGRGPRRGLSRGEGTAGGHGGRARAPWRSARRWAVDQRAYSTARDSRTTVTWTWPGYSMSRSMRWAMSRASSTAEASSTFSGSTMMRISRPAWMA